MIDNVQVQKRIFDLYGEKDYSIEEVKEILNKYQEKAKLWQEGLDKYTTSDVLNAIDEYWRFKNSEKKPRLVHIQAILNTNKIECYETNKNREEQEKLAILAEKTKEDLRKKMLEKFGG